MEITDESNTAKNEANKNDSIKDEILRRKRKKYPIKKKMAEDRAGNIRSREVSISKLLITLVCKNNGSSDNGNKHVDAKTKIYTIRFIVKGSNE